MNIPPNPPEKIVLLMKIKKDTLEIQNVPIAQITLHLSCYFEKNKKFLLLFSQQLSIFAPQNFRIINSILGQG